MAETNFGKTSDQEAELPAQFDPAFPPEIMCEVLRRADFATAAAALADEVLGELLWPHALYIAPAEWAPELAAHAAVCDRPAELAAVLARYPHARSHLCVRAVAAGGLPALKLAQAAGGPWGAISPIQCMGFSQQYGRAAFWGGESSRQDDVLRAAASAGHTDALAHLRNAGCFWTGETLSAAAGGGQLDTVKWLRERGCPWGVAMPWDPVYDWGRVSVPGAAEAAASAGEFETLRWLRAAGCPFPPSAVAWGCARAGRPDMLEWAVGKSPLRGRVRAAAISGAASGGHLELLQALLNGTEVGSAIWESIALTSALAGPRGRAVLKWAVTPIRFHPEAALAAVRGLADAGDLEGLKWLFKDYGFLPDDVALYNAVDNGHLETAKWLYSLGLIAQNIVSYLGGIADAEKFEGFVEWLDQIGELAQGHADHVASLFVTAGALGSTKSLEILSRHADPTAEVAHPRFSFAYGDCGLTWAALCCQPAAAEWFRARGAVYIRAAIGMAARLGDGALARQMYAEGCPLAAEDATWAGAAGRLDLCRWMIGEGCPLPSDDERQSFLDPARMAFSLGQHAAARELLGRSDPRFLTVAVSAAARRGDPAGVRAAIALGGELPSALLYDAAASGSLETVKLALELMDEKDMEPPTNTVYSAFNAAVVGEQLEVLEMVYAQGVTWEGRAVECIRRSPSAEVVEWARANGCPEPAGE